MVQDRRQVDMKSYDLSNGTFLVTLMTLARWTHHRQPEHTMYSVLYTHNFIHLSKNTSIFFNFVFLLNFMEQNNPF